MDVRSVSAVLNYSPPLGVNGGESINQQLSDLIQEYRAHRDDLDPTQLLATLQKLQSFIENNGNKIIAESEKTGFNQASKNWTEQFKTFFSNSIDLINQMKEFHQEHPSEALPGDSKDLLKEVMDHLHFLMPV